MGARRALAAPDGARAKGMSDREGVTWTDNELCASPAVPRCSCCCRWPPWVAVTGVAPKATAPTAVAGSEQPRAVDPGSARFDLTVGDLVPLSGDLEPFGPPGRKAADLAVAEAEDALEEADVSGVGVEVEHADTATSPQGAVSAARELIGKGSTCMAGAWASTDTIPAAQSVAAPERTPMISPASTSAQITTLVDEGFLFRTAPSNSLQGETLADVVEEELDGSDKTIAVAARNDAYGQGLANSFRRAWEAKGGELTGGPVLYDPDETDLKATPSRSWPTTPTAT